MPGAASGHVRNVNTLEGALEPSLASDAREAASRTAPFAALRTSSGSTRTRW